MGTKWRLAALSGAFLAIALWTPSSFAQSNPIFVPLGSAKGALYRPDVGPAPHVAVLLTHRTANYMSHQACGELSKRGFLVLCMNTRFEGNEELVRWEQMASDVKQGVNLLKAQPGISKIVFFGHSGGGPTLSFYQAVAENGISYCQGPQKLSQCDSTLVGLSPANGVVFIDGHLGNPVMMLRSLNPSVITEQNPPLKAIDPKLDPFDPRNGFNPNGPSHYSAQFQARYFAAQTARMNELIDRALDIQAQIAEGKYTYPDNDIFLIPRTGIPSVSNGVGGGAWLSLLDPSIELNRTTRPQKLLRNDDTIVVQPIENVAPAQPQIAITNLTFQTGTKVLDLKSFLSTQAVRSTDSLEGIDHCSSNSSTACAVQSISVPVLFIATGAFGLIRDGEIEYDLSRSADKDFIVVEGATHSITPCTQCEQFPGQYSNVTRNTYDYIANWINSRF